MEAQLEPKIILQRNLDERIAANSNYSLRAFARDLGLSPQNLSNIINGRRGIGESMALQLAEKLGLSSREQEHFRETSRALYSRSKTSRIAAKAKLLKFSHAPALATVSLELDLFKVISNWYYFGLMELLKISKNKKISFLAERLGIPENEAALALSRLERLKLISKVGTTYRVNHDMILADFAIPGEAVKNFHRQMIAKATQAIQAQSETERYGSSSVLPMRVKDLQKAKSLIQEFRAKLAAEVTDSVAGEEVYGLSIQIFKLSETSEHSKSIKKENL